MHIHNSTVLDPTLYQPKGYTCVSCEHVQFISFIFSCMTNIRARIYIIRAYVLICDLCYWRRVELMTCTYFFFNLLNRSLFRFFLSFLQGKLRSYVFVYEFLLDADRSYFFFARGGTETHQHKDQLSPPTSHSNHGYFWPSHIRCRE